jgi:hypothetical protein
VLAKLTVVVVTAVEANVIENTALAGKVDLVSVRALRNADAGSQSEQILKLPAEDWG